MWKDGALVRSKLQDCLDTCTTTGEDLVVVHGGCRSGADSFADGWARWQHRHRSHVALPEVHPAQWEEPCRDECRPGHRRMDPRGWDICPVAGFYRNDVMVRLGADVCLAFIADSSRGATHCADLAARSGIHVVTYRSEAESGQLRLG